MYPLPLQKGHLLPKDILDPWHHIHL